MLCVVCECQIWRTIVELNNKLTSSSRAQISSKELPELGEPLHDGMLLQCEGVPYASIVAVDMYFVLLIALHIYSQQVSIAIYTNCPFSFYILLLLLLPARTLFVVSTISRFKTFHNLYAFGTAIQSIPNCPHLSAPPTL